MSPRQGRPAGRGLSRHRRGIAGIIIVVIVVAVAAVVVVGGLFAAGIFKFPSSVAVAPTPTVTISPTSGPGNTSVSINATRLAPNANYAVFLSLLPGMTGYFLTRFNTTAAGTTEAAGQTFNVPPGVPAGRYYLDVVSLSTGISVPINPTEFTVTSPSVTIAPFSGPVGTSALIIATGLAPNESYVLGFDDDRGVYGAFGVRFTSGATGYASGPCDVPDIPVGSYYVDVFEVANGIFIVSTSNVGQFTVTPTDVAFGPTQGPLGTLVSFSAYGLQPTTKYNLSLDSTKGVLDENQTTFTTDQNGSSSGTFKESATVAFSYYVDVEPVNGGRISTASSKFKVTETSVTISPTSGPVNTSISIDAPGLAPNTPYTVAFDPTAGLRDFLVTNFTAIYNGSFNGTFNVPSGVPVGTYSVDLFQSKYETYTATASSPFTVTTPTVTISPTMGPGNTSMLISATGLAPTTSYSAFFGTTPGSSGYFLTMFTTAANGGFSGMFTVPSYVPAGGSYYLGVFAGSTGRYSYGTFIVDASSPFTLTGGFIPVVTINRTFGSVGTPVTLNATGLLANTAYDVDLDATQNLISYIVTTFMTDAHGSYNGTFTVPSYVVNFAFNGGYYWLNLLQEGSYWASPIEVSLFAVTTGSPVGVPAAFINPFVGPVNTLVSFNAVGLLPNTAYRACLNFSTLPGVKGYFLTNFTTDANGSYNATFKVAVPRNVYAGPYNVDVFQVSTGMYAISAQNRFTVTPDWEVSPFSNLFFGPVNTRVPFLTYGWVPKSAYHVYLDPTAGSAAYFAAAFTTPQGGYYVGSFTVPSYVPAGTYYVDLFGPAAGFILSAASRFTVTTPYVAISPTSGPAHSSVSILATGLAPSYPYSILFDLAPGAPDIYDAFFGTSLSGSYNGTFNVAFDVPAGTYYVDVFGPGFIISAASQFTVTTASATFSPTFGPVGTEVRLMLTRMAPSTLYDVDLDIVPGKKVYFGTTLETSANGSFNGTFNVPSGVPVASYWMDLFEHGSGNWIITTAATLFKVTVPSVAIGLTSGPVNTSVAINATGLAPSTTYYVYFDPTAQVAGYLVNVLTTNANGNYFGVFTASSSVPAGTYYVDVFASAGQGYIVSASSQFTVTN